MLIVVRFYESTLLLPINIRLFITMITLYKRRNVHSNNNYNRENEMGGLNGVHQRVLILFILILTCLSVCHVNVPPSSYQDCGGITLPF